MAPSRVFHEKVQFSRGAVTTTNFDSYRVLRMSEVPEVEVHVVPSQEKVGGAVEPGLPSVAPAVANAVFAASGVRVRRLPMDREALRSGARP